MASNRLYLLASISIHPTARGHFATPPLATNILVKSDINESQQMERSGTGNCVGNDRKDEDHGVYGGNKSRERKNVCHMCHISRGSAREFMIYPVVFYIRVYIFNTLYILHFIIRYERSNGFSHVLGQAASVTENEAVLPSKQHEQAILAHSMNTSIPDTEHNIEGMLPASCALSYKNKSSSSVRLANVDGMGPVN